MKPISNRIKPSLITSFVLLLLPKGVMRLDRIAVRKDVERKD